MFSMQLCMHSFFHPFIAKRMRYKKKIPFFLARDMNKKSLCSVRVASGFQCFQTIKTAKPRCKIAQNRKTASDFGTKPQTARYY